MATFPNAVVTFLPVHDGSILLIQRAHDEKNFPSLWAFPGGKVEVGETGIDAVVRELKEETGLDPNGKIAFLNSYHFGHSVGFSFLIETITNGPLELGDSLDHRWISDLSELREYPRIAGIDNHFVDASRVLSGQSWLNIAEVNLTSDRYINQ